MDMKIKKQSGSTFFVVLIIMVALTTLVGAAYEYTSTLQRTMQRTIALQQAQAIGSAAVEVAYTQWEANYVHQQTLDLSSSNFANILPLESSSFSSSAFSTLVVSNSLGATSTTWNNSGVTICNYGVVSANANFVGLDGTVSTGTSLPVQAYDQPMQTGSGKTGSSFYYLASADVYVPVLSGTVCAKVRRVFRKEFQNPFQYAIYFNDPLEIQPGAQMTITGKVFTNSDLWAAQGNNLTFNQSVSFAGSGGYQNNYLDYRGFLGNPTTDDRIDSRNGQTSADPITAPTFNAGAPTSTNSQSLYQAYATSDTLNGNPNNIYHDLIDPPPGALGMGGTTYAAAGVTDPFDNSAAYAQDNTVPSNFRFYDQASLVLYIDSSGNLQIINQEPAQHGALSGTAIPLSGTSYTTGSTTIEGPLGTMYQVLTASGTTYLSSTGTPINSGSSAVLNTALVYTALVGGTVFTATTSGSTTSITGTTAFASGTSSALPGLVNGVLASGTLYDGRQGLDVNYTQFNVGAASTNLNSIASSISNTTSIVYMRDARNDNQNATYDQYGNISNAPSITSLHAWKLANGQTIGLPELTIAAQNPVYVQGEFNTGGTNGQAPYYSSNAPSGTTVTATDYYITGSSATGNYGTQTGPPPTAIIADSIDVLSGTYRDNLVSGTATTASGDTINAAFLSGQVPTSTANNASANNYYSGGVENYPRFLENWNGVHFAYSGSIVELFKSKQAFKGWVSSSGVYSPPNRNWSFDSHFLSTPPTGFDSVIIFSRFEWFTQ